MTEKGRKRAKATLSAYERNKATEKGRRKLAHWSKMSNARAKARYKVDADSRQRLLGYAAKWREDNRSYDMGRKAIEGWSLTDEQKRRKNDLGKARLKRLTPEQRRYLMRQNSLKASAWAKKQRNDPEVGEYFRAYQSKKLPKEARAAARAKYDAIMAQRRFDRRRTRIEVLMTSCTEKQRERLMAKLEAFDRAQDAKAEIESNTKHGKPTTKKGAKKS